MTGLSEFEGHFIIFIFTLYVDFECSFNCNIILILLGGGQATAEANNLTAVAGAKDLYSKSMEKVGSFLLK